MGNTRHWFLAHPFFLLLSAGVWLAERLLSVFGVFARPKDPAASAQVRTILFRHRVCPCLFLPPSLGSPRIVITCPTPSLEGLMNGAESKLRRLTGRRLVGTTS